MKTKLKDWKAKQDFSGERNKLRKQTICATAHKPPPPVSPTIAFKID